MSRIIRFFLEDISVKFDAHKLKHFVDLSFILIEKIIVKLDRLFPFYLNFYEFMVENEVILAGISKKDKILHIGCGSIPATSILVAKKTGAEVVGIDKNIHSVKESQKLLLRYKIIENVRIEHADVLQYPINSFDFVIVSQGVKPYKEVLRYISHCMKKDSLVIFRTSSLRTGELAPSDIFLEDMFKIDRMIPQKKNGLLISVLLRKK